VTAVEAVHRSDRHAFSKQSRTEIRLLPGLGVEGDSHAGVTVQHRSRVRADPTQPNLRQVHLMAGELLDELDVAPGALGENVTTRGLDVLGLSVGTVLHLGDDATVRITGLRNPCAQIETFRPGLLKRVVSNVDGEVIRRAGIMGVVLAEGVVRPGDSIGVEAPVRFVKMDRV
jgi:MOSC domain-containing protein YiiM